MRLIHPSWKIIDQKPGLEGIYEQCEYAGRICYKSTRKEGTTAKDFVNKMIANGHLGVLEHGAVYLKFSTKVDELGREICTWFPKGDYSSNPYSKVVSIIEELEPVTDWQKELCNKMYITHYYITTNLRVLIENDWLDDLKYLCEPTEYHEKRITAHFVSNIHFYKDVTRHRKASFCIESTRYVNYSKDKFGNELTFIIPDWTTNITEGVIDTTLDGLNTWDAMTYGRPDVNGNLVRIKDVFTKDEISFLYSLKISENMYLNLINAYNWKPEQAADILPQATKADIIMSGFVSDWEHVFSLRADETTGKVYPEVKKLMIPLKEEFIKRNLL